MTEVMVHTLLDKSFSFTGSKFKHIQTSNEGEMSTLQNNELKESIKSRMNEECDKYFEGTKHKSDIDDDELRNASVSEVHTTKSGNSSKNLVQTESNESSDDYKVLATKTTVINTTYNLIAQSTKREIVNMTTNMERSPWPSFPNVMTEAVDKSRVIVQVLKSDAKSKTQNVIDNKPNPENQSGHSFRDDLYKLLSKSQSSQVEEEKSSDIFLKKDELHVSDASQNISCESQDSKTYMVKARRKRNVNFYVWNGRGTKVKDLKCVCENLREANPVSLRYLHYLMFNSVGLCGTGLQLLETKKNIGNFCGYPFKRSSEQLQKKLKCISKIPGPMLAGIHRALFGKTSVSNRSIMADQVINFLWNPRKCSEVLKKYDNKIKYMTEDEYAALKKSALKGPFLSVALKRLPENFIRSYTSDNLIKNSEMVAYQSSDQGEDTAIERFSNTLPAFILNGPGTKLKYFPKISNNVQSVHERSIKILHYILYGRIEPSINDCRRNILEFNGFSNCQREFVAERKDIIKKLNQRELFELCQILCIRAKTCTREMRIRKILKYLQSPSKPEINKSFQTSRWTVPVSSKSAHLKACLSNRSYKSASSPLVESDYSDEVFTNDDGWKLRNFKTIFSNVECAASSDLIELNDLLYFKTCDESDIHQKILDFSGFNFPVTSVHYDFRKTLMHYMGFCVVRKIACLLDIENWDKISNPDELSSNVLKFLMKKAEHDSLCSNTSSSFKSVKDSSLVSKPQSALSPKFVTESSDAGSSLSSPLLETSLNTNPENLKSLETEFHQCTNETFTHQKDHVIIQRLTKASVQTEEICQSNKMHGQSVQIFEKEAPNLCSINSSEDDSICLRDLIHHPSEQELKDLVFHLVKENLWCFTLGDLVKKVYACYPKVNLSYRENFIKAAARQMLSDLRDYAVTAVKDQTF